MAENFFLNIIFSFFDLAKGSAIVSIPVFVFVFVASLARKWLEKKYKWSWIKSSFVTTYFLVFSFVFVLYTFPIVQAFLEAGEETVLPEFAPTPLEIIVPIFLQSARLLLVALILTLLLLPLEFVGLYLFEKISQRVRAAFSVRLFLAVFLVTLFTFATVIFFAGWVFSGIIYLIFFG